MMTDGHDGQISYTVKAILIFYWWIGFSDPRVSFEIEKNWFNQGQIYCKFWSLGSYKTNVSYILRICIYRILEI